VLPLRVTLLAGAHTSALVARLFRAAWVEDRDVGDPEVVRALAVEVGLPADVVEQAGAPATKQALIDATAAARAAGVFGAPTAIVHSAGGPLAFWGQDRLDLVAAALRGWVPRVG
jgi:2-hydroxychromene-2-carboxylate isomerase